MLSAAENTPCRLIAPKLGLSAYAPQKLAGRIVEPRAWVPMAAGIVGAPTAAAEPLDEPPGVRAVSCGFRVLAGSPPPNVTVTVLPRIAAPPSLRASTAAASCFGRCPANSVEPYSVGMSTVSIRSLMPTGSPSTGESGAPAR